MTHINWENKANATCADKRGLQAVAASLLFCLVAGFSLVALAGALTACQPATAQDSQASSQSAANEDTASASESADNASADEEAAGASADDSASDAANDPTAGVPHATADSLAPLSDRFAQADMSGYEGLADTQQVAAFYTVTATDAVQLADEGASFALFCGFEDCFYCNQMIALLSNAALQADVPVAYIDTRADEAWTSNEDIDGYDEFMARFGDYAGTDDEGNPHLYVPCVIVVVNGQVQSARVGLLDEGNDPDNPLTDEQRGRLQQRYEISLSLLQPQGE